MEQSGISRRKFFKTAGLTTGYFILLGCAPVIRMAEAKDKDFVGTRQQSVYKADKKVYKIRKSQDNPMVKKLYNSKNGFLHDGPGGHMSHHLLHTHYTDRSKGVKALKAKGFKLKM